MLSTLSSDALLGSLRDVLRRERGCTIELLLHLAEMERRGLELELGYPTIYLYCLRELRMSSTSAFRRAGAASLLAKYPVAADYLLDGRLCLSTLVALTNVLTPENHLELFNHASAMTEEEVEQLVVAIKAKPELKDSIRAVKVKHMFVAVQTTSGPEVELVPLPPPPPRIQPVTPERYSVQCTVSKEVYEQLQQVKSSLSHVVPDGKLEDILAEAFRITLEHCSKRKYAATDAPRTSGPDVAPDSRTIPAAVRRGVEERDERQCTWVSPDGKRCESTHMLEFHHKEPFARGGAATLDNITLYCRAHNQHQARVDFGP